MGMAEHAEHEHATLEGRTPTRTWKHGEWGGKWREGKGREGKRGGGGGGSEGGGGGGGGGGQRVATRGCCWYLLQHTHTVDTTTTTHHHCRQLHFY